MQLDDDRPEGTAAATGRFLLLVCACRASAGPFSLEADAQAGFLDADAGVGVAAAGVALAGVAAAKPPLAGEERCIDCAGKRCGALHGREP